MVVVLTVLQHKIWFPIVQQYYYTIISTFFFFFLILNRRVIFLVFPSANHKNYVRESLFVSKPMTEKKWIKINNFELNCCHPVDFEVFFGRWNDVMWKLDFLPFYRLPESTTSSYMILYYTGIYIIITYYYYRTNLIILFRIIVLLYHVYSCERTRHV